MYTENYERLMYTTTVICVNKKIEYKSSLNESVPICLTPAINCFNLNFTCSYIITHILFIVAITLNVLLFMTPDALTLKLCIYIIGHIYRF